MKEILDVIHKTICQFFDEYNGETPISDKDKLLLEVNKAITNNLKALEREPFINNSCVYIRVCEHNKSKVLGNIRAEITDLVVLDAYGDYQKGFNFGLMRVAQIIDKYKESEE